MLALQIQSDMAVAEPSQRMPLAPSPSATQGEEE